MLSTVILIHLVVKTMEGSTVCVNNQSLVGDRL